MNEVGVTITGRNQLGSTLESVKRDIQRFGGDVSRLSSIDTQGTTAQKLNIRQTVQQSQELQKENSRQMFEEQRRALKLRSDEEFKILTESKKFRTSDMSQRQQMIEQFDKKFDAKFSDIDESEKEDLKNIDQEANQLLREINRTLTDQAKLSREEKQRDKEEFGIKSKEGYLGGLYERLDTLSNSLITAKTKEEAISIQKQINETKAKVKNVYSEAEPADEDDFDMAQSMRGRMMGRIPGGNTLQGIMGGFATGGALGAGVAAGMAVVDGIIDKFKEAEATFRSLNKVSSLGQSKEDVVGSLMSGYSFGNRSMASVGLTNEEALNRQFQLSKTSGFNKDVGNRAFDIFSQEKAFGLENLGGMSVNDRFIKETTQNNKDIADYSLEMLNTLTAIKESSLKTTDFSTFQEKMNIWTSLVTEQRSRTADVSNESIMRQIAAFEKIGVSKYGDQGASIIEQFNRGFESKGRSNLDVLKSEIARDIFPELQTGRPEDELKLRDIKRGFGTPEEQDRLKLGTMSKLQDVFKNDPIGLRLTLEDFFGTDRPDLINMFSQAGTNNEFKNIYAGKTKLPSSGITQTDVDLRAQQLTTVGEQTEAFSPIQDLLIKTTKSIEDNFGDLKSFLLSVVDPASGALSVAIKKGQTDILKNKFTTNK